MEYNKAGLYGEHLIFKAIIFILLLPQAARHKSHERGIKVVQTDNGSEFLGVFDKYLKERGIEHKFTYPRCPKINGYIERQTGH